jgi:hypothetical protein
MTPDDSHISHVPPCSWSSDADRPIGDSAGHELCHPKRHSNHEHVRTEAMRSLDESESLDYRSLSVRLSRLYAKLPAKDIHES